MRMSSVFSLESTTVKAGTYFKAILLFFELMHLQQGSGIYIFDRHVPQDRGFSHHHTYRYVCVLRSLACAWPPTCLVRWFGLWLDEEVRFYPISSQGDSDSLRSRHIQNRIGFGRTATTHIFLSSHRDFFCFSVACGVCFCGVN